MQDPASNLVDCRLLTLVATIVSFGANDDIAPIPFSSALEFRICYVVKFGCEFGVGVSSCRWWVASYMSLGDRDLFYSRVVGSDDHRVARESGVAGKVIKDDLSRHQALESLFFGDLALIKQAG